MRSWISVGDKLPPPGEEVWVYGEEDGVTIGFHSIIRGDGCWYHVYGDDDGLGDAMLYNVTHWQPLEKPGKPIKISKQAVVLTEAICKQNLMIADNIDLPLSAQDLHYIYETIGKHFSIFVATDEHMPSVHDIAESIWNDADYFHHL